MNLSVKQKILISIAIFMTTVFSFVSFADNTKIEESKATVISDIFKEAKANAAWKNAFLTAKHGQIVFMSVSPATNPSNEIGMEAHAFDQIIFVVEGNGKAILDGKTMMIKSGDLIFIPQGTAHNVINGDQNNPLKILSVYTNTDIPAKAIYKTKADATK